MVLSPTTAPRAHGTKWRPGSDPSPPTSEPEPFLPGLADAVNDARTEPDARRGARVETGFLVAILGVDASLVPRSGDISESGIYFDVDQPIGEIDMVHWLRIASLDGSRQIGLMAHVVRVETLADQGPVPAYGVAMEFMPDTGEVAQSIAEFVAQVSALAEHVTPPPRRAHALPGPALAVPDCPGSPRSDLHPSVRAITIETSWNVAVGDRVRVDIATPGMTRRSRLEGRATRVAPASPSGAAPLYIVDIELQAEEVRPPRRASSMTFPAVVQEDERAIVRMDDGLARSLEVRFSEILRAPPSSRGGSRRHHLSGSLSSIPLRALCTLVDMERLSGTLVLRRAQERATVFVDEGRLVDAEDDNPALTPRARLGRLLEWDEGVFELCVGRISRPDRIQMGTTALLIDLAREADERAPRRSP